MQIDLKPIPNNTKEFIIELDKRTSICEILARKTDNTKHFLHKDIPYEIAVNVVTQYLLKHKAQREYI